GDATLKVPVTGKALYDSAARALSLSAAGLPALESLGLKVVFQVAEDQYYRAVDIAPGGIVDGAFSAEISAGENVAGFAGSPLMISSVLRDSGFGVPLP